MYKNIFRFIVVILFISFAFSLHAQPQHYSIPIGSTKHAKSPLKGIGTVDKLINIEQSGWYELFIHSAPWPTDLFLDDELLGHFSFNKYEWKNSPKYKALNLYLTSGLHKISLQRLYHPGLPYVHSVDIKLSYDLTGKVLLLPKSDHAVFRKGENFNLHLSASKEASEYDLNFTITDAFTNKIITTLSHTIPSGSSLYSHEITIPTTIEGVFNVSVHHSSFGQVSRSFQYVVIDTLDKHSTSLSFQKKLINRIIPVDTFPDYYSPNTFVNNTSTLSPYLESGSVGVYGSTGQPSFFAYKLNLPDSSGFYLAEIDYPDNADRIYTVSLVERNISPYALDSGIVSGGHYPLTHKTQTTKLFFHAREDNPRLLFLNWHNDKRIAIKEIRIYRIQDYNLPNLFQANKSERFFGSFYEEPMRFTSYYGAKPSGNQWTEIYKSALRWANWSNFTGRNLWLQSIANYQHVMWPTNLLPGFAPSDEDSFSLLGPVSAFDFHKKDIIRLLLLIAEKHHISFIGELALPAQGYIKQALDNKFTSSTDIPISGFKPWLLVSRHGKTGGKSPFQPYFNPINPYVQKWIEDIFTELAMRYKDSSSFTGLAIRLMNWSFSSWQAFPSINWGYGDYTINKFEAETGIKIPITDSDDPHRFNKRYQWLTQNHYQNWIKWRCNKISEFHIKLYNILKQARPDLKLYINVFGPDYSKSDWGTSGGLDARFRKLDKIGWYNMILETGIDPLKYYAHRGIIFSNSFKYPAGIRAPFKTNGSVIQKRAHQLWQEANDSTALNYSKSANSASSLTAVRFDNAYMEYDFPVNLIGYNSLSWRKSKTLRIAAAVNPTGRAALRRYLWALSEANINYIADGGLGYIQGDPSLLQPFINEYHSLPSIDMKKVSSTDSISLWYGNKEGILYLYLVNTSSKKLDIQVKFSDNITLKRITKNQQLTTNSQNTVLLHLDSYELIAFKADKISVKPLSLNTLKQ